MARWWEHSPPTNVAGVQISGSTPYMVEFVVGSLLCYERFFFGYSGFPLSSKTNVSKFQFNQESGRWRTTLWMCYLQIVIMIIIIRKVVWLMQSYLLHCCIFTPPCSLRACTQAMVLLLLFSNYWMLMSILMLRRCLLLSVRVQVRDIKDGLSYTYSSNSSCHLLRSNFALLVMFVGRRSATVVRKICECFAVFSSCTKTTVLTQPRPKCFQVAIPYSANSLYYINLPDIAIYAFQIWSMLTGYEKLARGFEGIRNREIL